MGLRDCERERYKLTNGLLKMQPFPGYSNMHRYRSPDILRSEAYLQVHCSHEAERRVNGYIKFYSHLLPILKKQMRFG